MLPWHMVPRSLHMVADHLTLSSSLVARRSRLGGWVCFLLALVAGANACSDSNPSAPQAVGRTDNPTNDALTVDEPNLSATVVGSELRLDVPVTAVHDDAKGKLTVSVTNVDG